MTETTFSISELSKEFDMTTRAIRFYEDQGLLAPQREGRTRIFSNRDRVRLRLIQRGKRLGFSLQEIGEILDMYSDSQLGETAQLTYFLDRIRDQRKNLSQQVVDIEQTLEDLNTIERQCHDRLANLQSDQTSISDRIRDLAPKPNIVQTELKSDTQ